MRHESDDDAEDSDSGDGGDDDDDEDDDEQANLDYDFARGAELENSLLRLRHQWELKDQRRREKTEHDKEQENMRVSAAAAGPHKRSRLNGDAASKSGPKQGAHQIFKPAEATRMLCNELFDIMKEQQEGFNGVNADCVDHNIHIWRVQVSDIAATSPLKVDLDALHAKCGVQPVLELELSFTPDMHPFYPAFVKVLRPRFIGVVAEAVMTHPAMTLQGWDPMKPIKWLIRLVQSFLEKHGRIDLR